MVRKPLLLATHDNQPQLDSRYRTKPTQLLQTRTMRLGKNWQTVTYNTAIGAITGHLATIFVQNGPPRTFIGSIMVGF